MPFPGYTYNAFPSVTSPGGDITVRDLAVTKTGTGKYRVRFYNLASKWSDDGAVKVSSLGKYGVSRSIESTFVSWPDHYTDITCKLALGNLVDSGFSIMVSSRN